MPIVPKDWEWVYDYQTGKGEWAPPGSIYQCDYDRAREEQNQKFADMATPNIKPSYEIPHDEEPSDRAKEITQGLVDILWPIYKSLPEDRKRKFERAIGWRE